MQAILRYLQEYEILIYLGLGLLAVWQFRKFILAWEELRAAAFGLERESAQARLNTSAAVLALLLMAGITVYGLVTFLAPAVPGAQALPTPTLDLLATPTITLVPEAEAPEAAESTPGIETQQPVSGCLPDEVYLSSPADGDAVRDIVEVRGTADIADFGFYKFEVSSDGSNSWLTIQAGDTFKQDEQLGFWDTTQLEPGVYNLRLVVFDNQGNQRDPCQITVTVEPPTQE